MFLTDLQLLNMLLLFLRAGRSRGIVLIHDPAEWSEENKYVGRLVGKQQHGEGADARTGKITRSRPEKGLPPDLPGTLLCA